MTEIEYEILESLSRRNLPPHQIPFVRQAILQLSPNERKIILIQLAVTGAANMIPVAALQASVTLQQVNNLYQQTIRIREQVNVTNNSLRTYSLSLEVNVNLIRERTEEILRAIQRLNRLVTDRLTRLGLDILRFRSETLEALDLLLLRTSRLSSLLEGLEAEIQEISRIVTSLSAKLDPLITDLSEKVFPAITTIETRLGAIDTYIQSTLNPNLVTLGASVETLAGQLGVGLEAVAFAVTGLSESLTFTATTLGGAVVGLEGTIVTQGFLWRRQISALTRGFKENTKALEDLKAEFDKLPNQISDRVADNIVGESYYRFDSTSSYYPTVIFLFKLRNSSGGAGRSQIKLRLPKRSEEVSPEDLGQLRQRVSQLAGLSYRYGGTRLNFVSSDRLAKTVVHVEDPKEGSLVLERICGALGLSFDPSLISQTTGNLRQSSTARTSPLPGWDVRRIKNVRGPYQLFKVRLLINGMDGPLTLFSEDEDNGHGQSS